MAEASAAWLSEERLPAVNAVTFADDRMVLLRVTFYSGPTGTKVVPLGETTVQSFLSFNPEMWADATTMTELALPTGDKFLAGEASAGGDGFIALCSATGELRYSVFFDCSSPFVELSLDASGTRLSALNNNGATWNFDVSQPWMITVDSPR